MEEKYLNIKIKLKRNNEIKLNEIDPGFIMNSIPKNPIKQAKPLRIPTFSSKKNTAKTVIKMGAIKNIAVASARESSAIDIKKKVFAPTTASPLNI